MFSVALVFSLPSAWGQSANGPGQKIFFQAFELQKAGKLTEAAAKYEDGLKLEPKSAAARYFLGDLYLQLGQTGKAQSNFTQYLKLEPTGKYANQASQALSPPETPRAVAPAAPRQPMSADPTKIVLPSGLTLFDAADELATRTKTQDPVALLTEVSSLIAQYGRYPPLVRIQDALLVKAGSALGVRDQTTAQEMLPKIKELRALAPENLEMLGLEARAEHLLGNFTQAKTLYSQWLQTAPSNHENRKSMVNDLRLASEGRQSNTCYECIDGRYEILADGFEVKDWQTKLIWQRCELGKAWNESNCAGEGKSFDFHEAQRQARSGWRVPSIDELKTLLTQEKVNDRFINPQAFPNTSSILWSGSPGRHLSYAWYVSFRFGNAADDFSQAYGYAVRLVRSGQ